MSSSTQDKLSLNKAAQRTATALEDLQSRLAGDPADTPADLGKELEAYFSGPPAVRDEIRDRVIDGVADRILQQWEEPGGEMPVSFKTEVVARLVERVLQKLGKGPAAR